MAKERQSILENVMNYKENMCTVKYWAQQKIETHFDFLLNIVDIFAYTYVYTQVIDYKKPCSIYLKYWT